MSERFKKLLDEYPENAPAQFKKPELVSNVEDLSNYIKLVIRQTKSKLMRTSEEASKSQQKLTEAVAAFKQVTIDLNNLKQSEKSDSKESEALWKKLGQDHALLGSDLEATKEATAELADELKVFEEFYEKITEYQKKVDQHLAQDRLSASQQAEEVVQLSPDDEIIEGVLVEEPIAPLPEKGPFFDKELFTGKLAKQISAYALAEGSEQRPKTDELQQINSEFKLAIEQNSLTVSELKSIIDEAIRRATRTTPGYMKGIEEALYKKHLLPKL